MTNLKSFTSWEKARIHIYKTKDGKYIYAISHYNMHFGDIFSRFQIDDVNTTDVKCKYTGNILDFQVNNNLCGEREFEKGSMFYEYVVKPLGLDITNVPCQGADGWQKMYNSRHWFEIELAKVGGIKVNDGRTNAIQFPEGFKY